MAYHLCAYGVPEPTDEEDLFNKIRSGKCSPGTFDSKSQLRKCIPRDSAASIVDPSQFGRAVQARDIIKRAFGSFTLYGICRDVLLDLSRSYHLLIGCAVLTVAISFTWLWLMQRSVRIMVWFTVGAFVATSVGSTVYFFYQWKQESHDYDTRGHGTSGNTAVMLWFSIILAIFTFLVLIILIFVRSKISIAIEIVQEAATAIDWIPQLTFFPFLIFVVLISYIAYAITVCVYLATSGAFQIHEDRLQFKHTVTWMMIYHIIASTWLINILLAISSTTTAGCVASWYFTPNKLLMPSSPVSSSLSRVLRYHFGSLVLGSAVITFVQTVRFIIDAVRTLIGKEKKQNHEINLVSCSAGAMDYVWGWVETIIRSINKNAYIEVAIYGHSFCHSARVAFRLLARNVLRMLATEYIGDFILFLGKSAVTVVVGAVAMELLDDDDLQLRYYSVLVGLVMAFAYTVASSFMSVFAISIATIFLCFCEDIERNDGSAQRPYYMTPTLAAAMRFDNEQTIDL